MYISKESREHLEIAAATNSIEAQKETLC